MANPITEMLSMRRGASKARRDIAAAKEFLSTDHEDSETDEFFASLGDDVSRNDEIEMATYGRAVDNFQRRWIESHPNPMANLLPIILSARNGGQNITEVLDQISNALGNQSRADECDTLKMLRATASATETEDGDDAALHDLIHKVIGHDEGVQIEGIHVIRVPAGFGQ